MTREKERERMPRERVMTTLLSRMISPLGRRICGHPSALYWVSKWTLLL